MGVIRHVLFRSFTNSRYVTQSTFARLSLRHCSLVSLRKPLTRGFAARSLMSTTGVRTHAFFFASLHTQHASFAVIP